MLSTMSTKFILVTVRKVHLKNIFQLHNENILVLYIEINVFGPGYSEYHERQR